ncbi:hypothetical protein VOI32_12390 [Paraburkholderia caribensis]|uniref:Uncharacterized protein n=1 Tax=Paraburkholderia caribensis TaxID=75105 RepID=A0ABV0DXC3_9BURK|nr:hypothetical protein [Paraburkholderia caribensis]
MEFIEFSLVKKKTNRRSLPDPDSASTIDSCEHAKRMQREAA